MYIDFTTEEMVAYIEKEGYKPKVIDYPNPGLFHLKRKVKITVYLKENEYVNWNFIEKQSLYTIFTKIFKQKLLN